MRPVALIVEPNVEMSVVVQKALSPSVDVVVAAKFQQARDLLRERSFQWLVTNLRLAAFNGLHLVLVAPAGLRSVVYSTAGLDPVLAMEAQRHGAFYESAARLPSALPAYINAALPPLDRRNVAMFDRRVVARGGRRASDAALQQTC
jgi:DNA-binding NtrC family response regulator